MLSLNEVRCPHCGARGQLMLPPAGSLVVGPCPECDELVLIFAGQVLALEKDIVLHAPPAEKRDHLMNVLTSFLHGRVTQFLEDIAAQEHAAEHETGEYEPAAATEGPGDDGAVLDHPSISSGEIERFKQIDLRLLDNPEYFKAVFG